MIGISIVVDDAAAALKALKDLGLPEASSKDLSLDGGEGAVMAGDQFIAVIPRALAADGGMHQVYLEGARADAASGNAGGVAFKRWTKAATKSSPVNPPSVEGVDHLVAVVKSIDQAGSALGKLGITRHGGLWDYPGLSARARLFDLEKVWLELNEPLKSGESTIWGAEEGLVGVVLRTRDVEGLVSQKTALKFTRRFPVQARPTYSEEMITLGLVTQLRNDAFGKLAIYIYQPFEKGPSPKDVSAD